MSGYDPQARRGRAAPPEVSPVDGLLGDEPEAPPESPDGHPAEPEAAVDGAAADPEVGDASGADGEVRPFDAPPVEMADERADRLHRLGVLGAVVAAGLLLLAWRRRRGRR